MVDSHSVCAQGEQWLQWASGVKCAVSGVWPLQRTALAAAGCGRPHYANLAPEGLRLASSASRRSGEKLRLSVWKNACLRARSERILREMGPPNPVLYVGTKTPGLPGFS